MSGYIICGIDGSSEAGRAAAVAARLGRDLGSRAVLVNADEARLPDQGFRLPRLGRTRRRRRLLKATAAMAAFTEDVEFSLHDGDPADALLAAARDRDAELIVVSSGGLGTASPVLIGGTASALMKNARCPVVVVPSAAVPPLDAEGMRGVVCAVEGRASDAAVLALAADLSARLGGALHAVAALDALTDGDLGCDVEVHPVDSATDEPVRRVAGAARAGLVVVGPPDAGEPDPTVHVPLPIALVATAGQPVVVLSPNAELHLGSGHYELAAGVR